VRKRNDQFWMGPSVHAAPNAHSRPHLCLSLCCRPLLLSLIGLLTYLSFRGLTVVGGTAVVLTAFTLLPFAIFCMMAAPSFDPAPLQHVRSHTRALSGHSQLLCRTVRSSARLLTFSPSCCGARWIGPRCSGVRSLTAYSGTCARVCLFQSHVCRPCVSPLSVRRRSTGTSTTGTRPQPSPVRSTSCSTVSREGRVRTTLPPDTRC